MNTLITVVIPTFQRPEFLETALGSVETARIEGGLGQKDLEIVVVDDGHDEVAKRVCETSGASARIRYFRSHRGPGAGPSVCRDQGIQRGKGEFIYLLDDDDAYLPNRFAKSIGLLKDDGFDVILEPSLRVYIDESNRSPFTTGPYGDPYNAFRFLITGGGRSHVTPGGTAFRKSIYYKAGGYDETLRYGEDGELLLRLCLVGRVALVGGDPVVKCSIHVDNSSRPDRLQVWQNIKGLARLYQKMRIGPWPDETTFIRRNLSAKLDFALSEARRTAPSYAGRISSGGKALRYFDWRCTSINNVKSIGVWLTKKSTS